MVFTAVQAPQPPGRLGERVDPPQLRGYLIAMDGWLEARKGELDAIDEVAQNAANADELTPDIRLSMSLWQSIQSRYVKLLQVWDSGRVGPKEREQLSALIWGHMDEGAANSAAKGLSLPEACKLSDALTSQLRMRMQLDPTGSESLGRLRNLRASIERLRDQVALEPEASRVEAQQHFQQLAGRVEDLAERASRGGDIGGMLGPLEIETAKFERDLIVNGALRRQSHDERQIASAQGDTGTQQQPPVDDGPSASTPLLAPPGEDPRHFAQRAYTELAARGEALQVALRQPDGALRQEISVPDVTVLGSVPADDAHLVDYINRLRRIDEAMDYVEARVSDRSSPAQLASNLVDMTAQQLPTDDVVEAIVTAARKVAASATAPAEIVEELLRIAHSYAASLTTDQIAQPLSSPAGESKRTDDGIEA